MGMREGWRLRESVHNRHDVDPKRRYRRPVSIGEQERTRLDNRRGGKASCPTNSSPQDLLDSARVCAQRIWNHVGILR